MKSIVKTFKLENDEIQRVQVVTLDDWDSLEFFNPVFSKDALINMTKLFKDFYVKKHPFLFGTLYLYHIPQDYELPFVVDGIKDKYIASRIYLKENFNTPEAKSFIKDLKEKGYLYVVKGLLPFVREFMPFKNIGFLSNKQATLKVNTSFFSLLSPDVKSKYDIYGTPVGMYVKDGEVLNPPLFNREAFIVYEDGEVTIRKINLGELDIGIEGKIYERINYKKTPKSNDYDLVVIGDEIVAINKGGNSEVPSTGFVINTKEDYHFVGEKILYQGLEDVVFGIQCGNSAIINNKGIYSFKSKFTNILRLENDIPPSLYTLDYEKDRQPRMALAQTSRNKPMLIWFEGKSKFHYEKGKDSVGASLKEVALILEKLKVKNAINLDGGGSAQIIIDNCRNLRISDRDKKTNKEVERPVPVGIFIE